MRSTAPAAPSEPTLIDLGTERLRALCRSTRLDDRGPVHLFQRVVSPWGFTSVANRPAWPSEVGDDNTPFEFSLAVGESPELRVMVEPLGEEPSLRSNAAAAMALLESLEHEFDVDLERLNRVRDLFLPPSPRGAFALWVAAEFAASRAPQFKAYLNPFIQGIDLAPALIEEALMRLGFEEAWPFITRVLTRRGADLDELMYLSLDLSRAGQARVKVYARHRRSTVADLEAAASGSPGHRAGDVSRFLSIVSPDRAVFEGRAPFTCYAFVQGAGPRPAAVTTHFPINGYAKDDAVVLERVSKYLDTVGLPSDVYRSALTAFANRPLEDGIGIQSYVSIRRHHGKPRLTVYLPVEAYRPGTIAKPPWTLPPSGVRERVARFEQATVNHDPFVRRLRREPFHARNLSRVVFGHELSVSRDLGARAARIAERVDDAGVKSALRGRFDREASLQRFPDGVLDAGRSPARSFASWIDHAFSEDANVYEAVGVLAACELLDQQIIRFAVEQLERAGDGTGERPVVTEDRIDLAERRGKDAMELTRLLPEEALDPAWRGARAFWRAEKGFLGELYTLCYRQKAKR